MGPMRTAAGLVTQACTVCTYMHVCKPHGEIQVTSPVKK